MLNGLFGQNQEEAVRRFSILQAEKYRPLHCGLLLLKGMLIVEIDGGQHYESDGMIKDRKRDLYLQMLGFTVLRFSDIDVLKILME